MPTGRLYRNGLTLGMGGNPNPVGGKRGKVNGWTAAAVRRHTRWLYSVDAPALDGQGWAVTLTVRDLPDTSDDWHRIRAAYLERVRRSGWVKRSHWVTEWTRRRRPHMHQAFYLAHDVTPAEAWRLLVAPWIEVAGKYGATAHGQHLARIEGPLGWLEYLSKHAARGVSHYQRQGSPPGWETTGRLWGYGGQWPIVEPAEVTLTRDEFFRFRRLVRSWRIADARRELVEAPAGLAGEVQRRKARRRLVAARRMLRASDREHAQVRGVSEWISEDLGMVLLAVAAGETPEAPRAAAPGAPRRASGWTVEDF